MSVGRFVGGLTRGTMGHSISFRMQNHEIFWVSNSVCSQPK
jgi:hypothetical protein